MLVLDDRVSDEDPAEYISQCHECDRISDRGLSVFLFRRKRSGRADRKLDDLFFRNACKLLVKDLDRLRGRPFVDRLFDQGKFFFHGIFEHLDTPVVGKNIEC